VYFEFESNSYSIIITLSKNIFVKFIFILMCYNRIFVEDPLENKKFAVVFNTNLLSSTIPI